MWKSIVDPVVKESLRKGLFDRVVETMVTTSTCGKGKSANIKRETPQLTTRQKGLVDLIQVFPSLTRTK